MPRKPIASIIFICTLCLFLTACNTAEKRAAKEAADRYIAEANAMLFSMDDEVTCEAHLRYGTLSDEQKTTVIEAFTSSKEIFDDKDMAKREPLVTPGGDYIELQYTLDGEIVTLRYIGNVEGYEYFIIYNIASGTDSIENKFMLNVDDKHVGNMVALCEYFYVNGYEQFD